MIRTSTVTAMWLNAITSANNAIRAARIEELNGRTDDDRDGNRTVGAESFTAFSHYLNADICPNAFITIPMPFATTSESVRARRNVRSAEFYLRMWTRDAERRLWGASAARVKIEDCCLFFFVRETIHQDGWKQD